MSPVKGFVGDVWKIAAACASGAFLLSLVTGLFAGNPFGVVIFRAFLLGLLFAGLGAGLRLVIRTYLPELIGPSPPAGADEGNRGGAVGRAAPGSIAGRRGGDAEGSSGSAVDIVLAEDDGLRRQAYAGSSRSHLSRPAATTADTALDTDAALEASLDEDFMSQGETSGLPDLDEELAEELPPALEPTATGGSAGVRSEEGAVEESESPGGLPRGMRESPGSVDSLPDIEVLESAEEKPEPPASRPPARPLRSAAGGMTGDAVRSALSGQDPSTLARAIRTVLKNAEKG
jgi:hypothetical protein